MLAFNWAKHTHTCDVLHLGPDSTSREREGVVQANLMEEASDTHLVSLETHYNVRQRLLKEVDKEEYRNLMLGWVNATPSDENLNSMTAF